MNANADEDEATTALISSKARAETHEFRMKSSINCINSYLEMKSPKIDPTDIDIKFNHKDFNHDDILIKNLGD